MMKSTQKANRMTLSERLNNIQVPLTNAALSVLLVRLFLAFELGATKWELAFSTGFGQKPRRRTIEAGETKVLRSEIAAAKKRFGLAQDTPVKSCYEAGRDGFWLDRYLTSIGVENLVVDSSSIEVNRRAKHAKTDRIDAGQAGDDVGALPPGRAQVVECGARAQHRGRRCTPSAS
jgi:hypothetical protein